MLPTGTAACGTPTIPLHCTRERGLKKKKCLGWRFKSEQPKKKKGSGDSGTIACPRPSSSACFAFISWGSGTIAQSAFYWYSVSPYTVVQKAACCGFTCSRCIPTATSGYSIFADSTRMTRSAYNNGRVSQSTRAEKKKRCGRVKERTIAGNNACWSPTSKAWGTIGFRSFRHFDIYRYRHIVAVRYAAYLAYGANLRKGYLEPAFGHLSPTRGTVVCAVRFCFIAGMLAAIWSICRKCYHCGCLLESSSTSANLALLNADALFVCSYNYVWWPFLSSWIVKLASFLFADWAVKRCS